MDPFVYDYLQRQSPRGVYFRDKVKEIEVGHQMFVYVFFDTFDKNVAIVKKHFGVYSFVEL